MIFVDKETSVVCVRPCLVRKSGKHQIKQPVTYKNENVCYLINFAKCCDQYIGETELQFHKRMNNQKSDIRTNKKSNGMMRHFSRCGIENLKPAVLEKVRSRNPFIRKAREQYYIQFNLRHSVISLGVGEIYILGDFSLVFNFSFNCGFCKNILFPLTQHVSPYLYKLILLDIY